MEILHAINWPFVASGFGVGALVGLTGVGGGSLMTPILILLFGVLPLLAVGTDLLYAAATKSAGTLVHGFNHTIEWRIVGRLAMGSVPAAIVMLVTLHFLGISSSQTNTIVTEILGVALLLTAAALIFRRQLLSVYAHRVGKLDDRHTRNYTILTGAVVGALVSVTSVGAGALGVTALILLYPELPIARIVGSDVAHAVPLTLVAGTGHWLLGSVDTSMLGALLMGSLPGIFVGSTLAPRVPDPALRWILAGVLVFVAARLLHLY